MIWKRKEQGRASNSSLVENFQEASGNTVFSSNPSGEDYPSPLFADVAKTIKAVQDTKGLEKALNT
jgi:hypothetical protein